MSLVIIIFKSHATEHRGTIVSELAKHVTKILSAESLSRMSIICSIVKRKPFVEGIIVDSFIRKVNGLKL